MSDPTLSPSPLESSSPALDSGHETQSAYGGPTAAPKAQSQGTHEASHAARQGQANDVAAANAGLTQASSGVGMNPQGDASKAAAGDVRSALGMDLPPPQPLGSFDPELSALIRRTTGADLSRVTVSFLPELEQQGKLGVAQAGKTIGLSPKIKGNPRKTLRHEAGHTLQHPSSGVPKAKPQPGQQVPDIEQEAIQIAESLDFGKPVQVFNTVGDEPLYQTPGEEKTGEEKTEPSPYGAGITAKTGPSPYGAGITKNPELLRSVWNETKSTREVNNWLSRYGGPITDPKIHDIVKDVFGSEQTYDAWRAKNILKYGPEEMWPSFEDVIMTIVDGKGITHEMKIFYYKGTDKGKHAFITGGVHGNEQSGIDIANRMNEKYKKDSAAGIQPFRTTIIIPKVFPQNGDETKCPNDPEEGCRRGESHGAPSIGETLEESKNAKGQHLDAADNIIDPSNLIRLEIIEQWLGNGTYLDIHSTIHSEIGKAPVGCNMGSGVYGNLPHNSPEVSEYIEKLNKQMKIHKEKQNELLKEKDVLLEKIKSLRTKMASTPSAKDTEQLELLNEKLLTKENNLNDVYVKIQALDYCISILNANSSLKKTENSNLVNATRDELATNPTLSKYVSEGNNACLPGKSYGWHKDKEAGEVKADTEVSPAMWAASWGVNTLTVEMGGLGGPSQYYWDKAKEDYKEKPWTEKIMQAIAHDHIASSLKKAIDQP